MNSFGKQRSFSQDNKSFKKPVINKRNRDRLRISPVCYQRKVSKDYGRVIFSDLKYVAKPLKERYFNDSYLYQENQLLKNKIQDLKNENDIFNM